MHTLLAVRRRGGVDGWAVEAEVSVVGLSAEVEEYGSARGLELVDIVVLVDTAGEDHSVLV